MRYENCYKISWGKDDRRDRWGHFVAPATMHTEWANRHDDAIHKAIEISKAHPKCEVVIYDIDGPSVEEDGDDSSHTWVVKTYKAGELIFTNDEYYNYVY